MKKRILSMVLVVAMVVAMIPAALISVFAIDADGYDNGYGVYISHDEPTLDGQKDAMYDNSEKIVNTYAHTAGASFEAYALVTAKGLYLYADIKDPTVVDDGAGNDHIQTEKGYSNPADGDKLALFLQVSNTVAGQTQWAYGYFDMDYANDHVSAKWNFNYAGCNDVKVSTITTDGWTVEFFMPWENCSSTITTTITPQTVGVYFGIQVNNYTAASGGNQGLVVDNPKCMDYWHGTSYTDSYALVDGAPKAYMIPAVLIPTKGANSYHDGYDAAVAAPGQIELDGELDSVYLASEKIYNNKQWHAGNDFYAYTVVTQKGIYFWVRIFDESVDPAYEAGFSDARSGDKLQIDLQIQNGSQFTWGYFDLDYSSLPVHKSRDYATNKCVPQKATKIVYGGWTAEVYIPWDSSAKVDTSDFSKISAYIGFQVNNYGGASGTTNYGQAYDHPNASGYYSDAYSTAANLYTKVNFDYTGAKEYDSNGAKFPGFSVYSHGETITVDAKRDEVYLKSQKISEKYVYGTDTGFDAYITVTADGIYVYNEIEDPTIGYEYMKYNTASNKVGNHDKFQFYFIGSSGTMNYIELDYYANNVDGETYTQEEGLQTLTHVNVSNVTLSQTAGDGGAEYATKILRDKNGTAYAWVAEIFIPWSAATAFSADVADTTKAAPYACSVGLQADNDTWIEGGTRPDALRHYCYSNYARVDWWSGAADADKYFVPLTYTTYVAPTNTMHVTSEYIELDGKLDDVYLNSFAITDNNIKWSGSKRQIKYTAYPIATPEGLYLWVEVDDSTMNNINDTNAETGDMVQVYLDWTEAYRSHEVTGKTGDAYRYDDTFFFGGWFAFDYEGYIAATNDISAQKSGSKSAVVKYENPDWDGTDTKTQYIGYAIEAFIPWNTTMQNLIGAHKDDIHMGIGVQVSDDETYDYDSTGATVEARKEYRTSIAYDTAKGGSYYGYYEWLPNVNFIYAEDLPMFGANIGDKVDSVTLDGVNTSGEYDGAAIVHVNIGGGGTADAGDIYRVVATEDAIYVLMELIDNTPSTTTTKVGSWYDYVDMAFSFNGRFATMFTFNRSEGAPSFGLSSSRTDRWYRSSNLSFTAGETIACSNSADKWSYELKIPLTAQDKADMADGTFFMAIGTQFLDSYSGGRNYKYNVANSGIYSGETTAPSEVIKFAPVVFAENGNANAFTGANVALGESINVNYYANVSINDLASAKVKFTFNEQEYWAGPKTSDVAGQYIFTFEGIAPQCMGDNIKAELYVGGNVVSTKDDYSVAKNLNNTKTNYAETADLVNALLHYGAATQNYAHYNTGNLVNAGLAAPTYSTIVNNDRVIGAANVAGAKFSAAGVYHANANKIYAKVTVTEADVDNLSVKINGIEAALELFDAEKNVYIVYTDDVKVTSFDKVYSFVLTDGTNVQTLTYSVNAYCATKQTATNADTAALANAMYAYGIAAEAFIAG